jgi:membrane-associated protease RseP (regulator of RpoE activity)
LHGAAKHHRSPDAEVSHKGKKHIAVEEKKTTAKPAEVAKTKKKEIVKKEVVKKEEVKKHVVKHVAAGKRVVSLHPGTHHGIVHHHAMHKAIQHHAPARSEAVTLTESKPTTEIEIKDGNVIVNDNFVLKIKSLKNEDDKITLHNVTPTQVTTKVQKDDTENENNEADHTGAGSGKPILGVYSHDFNDRGAQVEGVVPGSPAHETGLCAGDVITKADDREISNSQDLVDAVNSHSPGDEVIIVYWHLGRKMISKVILGDAEKMNKEDSEPVNRGYYKSFYHGRWR